MERWLSLKILESAPSQASSGPPKAGPPLAERARVQISIPKRTVKLAVTRNRLKRVLREAVRRDPFFAAGKIYRLQVREMPKKVGLDAARATLEALHD